MALSDEQDKASFKGAASLEANFDPRDRIALYEAVKKIRLFCDSILYRTSNVWMGQYMNPPMICSKCGKEIPESEIFPSKLDMSAMNEGFGNGGAVWTCPKCL